MTEETSKENDKPEGSAEPKGYVPKTDAVLKEIALGILEGHIFCDRQIVNKDDTPMVFMILALMDDATAKQLKHQNICLLYEYINKSGPMGVNGMPVFMSMRCLNKEDTEKMFVYYQEAEKMRDSFLNN